MRNPQRFQISAPAVARLFLLLGAFLSASWPAEMTWAAQPAHYQSDVADLTQAADTVLIGILEKHKIGISDTVTDVRITQVYKGGFRPGQMIQVLARSGRVMVSADQPNLTGVRQAVFFLQNPSTANLPHTFFKDNYGLKPIIHDNVYTNPQDPIQTVKLKKYQEALAAAAATPKAALPTPESMEIHPS